MKFCLYKSEKESANHIFIHCSSFFLFIRLIHCSLATVKQHLLLSMFSLSCVLSQWLKRFYLSLKESFFFVWCSLCGLESLCLWVLSLLDFIDLSPCQYLGDCELSPLWLLFVCSWCMWASPPFSWAPFVNHFLPIKRKKDKIK